MSDIRIEGMSDAYGSIQSIAGSAQLVNVRIRQNGSSDGRQYWRARVNGGPYTQLLPDSPQLIWSPSPGQTDTLGISFTPISAGTYTVTAEILDGAGAAWSVRDRKSITLQVLSAPVSDDQQGMPEYRDKPVSEIADRIKAKNDEILRQVGREDLIYSPPAADDWITAYTNPGGTATPATPSAPATPATPSAPATSPVTTTDITTIAVLAGGALLVGLMAFIGLR